MSETNLQLFPGVFRSTVGGENPGFFLHSDGRVGIGNKAPTARPTWSSNDNDRNKLNVTGHTHIDGNLNVTGHLYGDGSNLSGVAAVIAGNWDLDETHDNIKYDLGNVGIGGAASTEKLTIYGDLNIKNSGQLKFDGADAVFSKWSSDTNGIYRPSNVGIGGVPSATNKLKVHGTVEASGLTVAGAHSFPNRPIAVVGRNNLPSEGQRNTYPHPSGIFIFNTALINSGIYNSSNGRFTVPSGYGGYYLLSFTGLSGYYNTNAPNTRWYQNGSEEQYGAYHTNLGVNIASAMHVGISGMHIINLAANQYVDLRVVGGTLYGQHTLHAYAVCLYLGAA